MCCNGSPAPHPASDVAQLTPRMWKESFAAYPMTSDIGTGVMETCPPPPQMLPECVIAHEMH